MYSDYYGHNGPLTWRQDRLARRERLVREQFVRGDAVLLDDLYDWARYLREEVRGYQLEERDRVRGVEPGTWGAWEAHTDAWLAAPFAELLLLELAIDKALEPSLTT